MTLYEYTDLYRVLYMRIGEGKIEGGSMKKKIAYLLMVIGIIILLIPSIGKLYTKYKQDQIYQEYLQYNEQLQNAFQESPQDVSPEQQFQDANKEGLEEKVNLGEAMGVIKIPKIDVELLVVEGVTSKDLKLGAGHMPQTALPGQTGNCAIAGHRSYTFDTYFNRLDEVEIGDKVMVETPTQEYTYEVYEVFIVEPTDVEVLNQNMEESILTLITCEPIVEATHRLIVRGKLMETK